MGLDLFEMMEKAKGFLRGTIGVLTDDKMQPTAAERKKWDENCIFHLKMGKGLSYFMEDYRKKKLVTQMESALLQEIMLMEQRFCNQLPMHLKETKYEEVSLLVTEPGLAKCMFRSLLELESVMKKIRIQSMNNAKKERKKKKKQASTSGVHGMQVRGKMRTKFDIHLPPYLNLPNFLYVF